MGQNIYYLEHVSMEDPSDTFCLIHKPYVLAMQEQFSSSLGSLLLSCAVHYH